MKTVQPLYLPAPYQDAVHQGRIILRDGSTASVRTTTPQDREALTEFYRQLSPQSRRFRFFSEAKPGLDVIDRFCDSSNPKEQMTLVALRFVAGTPRIIATGSYVAHDGTTAEFAVAVGDDFHGKGLGGLLFERLAVIAAASGFVNFMAITDPTNHAMLDVFRHSGFEVRERMTDGYVRLDISMQPRRQSVAHAETRDRVYTTASLRPFFKPNAVAVVGASRDPSSIGYRMMDQLMKNHFNGPIYPVNPNAAVVCSIRAYKSVREIPEPVDLAIIIVPKDAVPGVIDDCAARGVRAVVVISAGFAETDAAGRALQQQLLDKVRGYGMRMVGPNCLGLINADPEVRLGATFTGPFPASGNIAMSSQSGALGIAILDLAARLNLGLSTFVSVGNKADVTGNDLLQYWEDDPATNVILLYLESFGNPRRFARIARRVSRSKPIVCVKSGRASVSGRGGAANSLGAGDTAVEALFQQTGVIRAETLEEMFDLAATLSHQPLPRGKRVGIVTNAGGPGILCADACEAGGLLLAPISDSSRNQLRGSLPGAASLNNPVDITAAASPEHFKQAVEIVLRDESVDSLIAIYIPIGTTDNRSFMEAVSAGVAAGRASGAKDKPVIAVMMTEDHANVPMTVGSETLPRYLFPESAARVLSKVAHYATWRRQSAAVFPDFDDIDAAKARETCRRALAQRGGGWLSNDESRSVLECFRLPMAPGALARTADEAVAAADRLGYPVAVKLDSLTLVRKSEIGGVVLNVMNAAGVRAAVADIQSRLASLGQTAAMNGVLVQPMIQSGTEVMCGVTEDPLFGPLISFGLGGIHVEILKDVVHRITPLTEQDARDMVSGIRGHRLLRGYRGHAAADTEAIAELLLRVALLVEEIPEIRELEMNPIFALEPGHGCRVADIRIRVEPVSANQPVRYVKSAR